jgi:hypothetical protein
MGIDLVGNGVLSLSFDSWRACQHLAQLFGWTPGPTLKSDCPERYSYGLENRDARALALALYRAIRNFENGMGITPGLQEVLRDARGLGRVRAVADYALTGGFGVST